MKLNSHCKLRHIADEDIIVRPGNTETDLTSVISFNTTSAWLWQQLTGKEFSANDAVDLLQAHYEVNIDKAVTDVQAWLSILEHNNLLEL